MTVTEPASLLGTYTYDFALATAGLSPVTPSFAYTFNAVDAVTVDAVTVGAVTGKGVSVVDGTDDAVDESEESDDAPAVGFRVATLVGTVARWTDEVDDAVEDVEVEDVVDEDVDDEDGFEDEHPSANSGAQINAPARRRGRVR